MTRRTSDKPVHRVRKWEYHPHLLEHALLTLAQRNTPDGKKDAYNEIPPEEQQEILKMSQQISAFIAASRFWYSTPNREDLALEARQEAFMRIVKLVRERRVTKDRFRNFGGFVTNVCGNIVKEARRCVKREIPLSEMPEDWEPTESDRLTPGKTRYAKRITAKWEASLSNEQLALLVFRYAHLLGRERTYIQRMVETVDAVKNLVHVFYTDGKIETLSLDEMRNSGEKPDRQTERRLAGVWQHGRASSMCGIGLFDPDWAQYENSKAVKNAFDLDGIAFRAWHEAAPKAGIGIYEKHAWPQCRELLVKEIGRLKQAQRKMLIREVAKRCSINPPPGTFDFGDKKEAGNIDDLIGLKYPREILRKRPSKKKPPTHPSTSK